MISVALKNTLGFVLAFYMLRFFTPSVKTEKPYISPLHLKVAKAKMQFENKVKECLLP